MRFSQNDEDLHILRYFGNEVGTFLDAGANDGRTLSNTHALALRGWSGVCVEPSPVAFARLRELYADNPRIETHNVGMCAGNGTAILHESGTHLGLGDHSLLSTAKPAEMERWKSSGAKFTPVDFECVTFIELLRRSEHAHFDLISIDIEGADLELLEQIDLNAVECRCLCVEWNGQNERLFTSLAKEGGLRLLTKNPENLIFCR